MCINNILENGVDCKKMARRVRKKDDWWREGKANIIYFLMELKFQQCKEFRETLLSTGKRPLIHPVGHEYWGTGT